MATRFLSPSLVLSVALLAACAPTGLPPEPPTGTQASPAGLPAEVGPSGPSTAPSPQGKPLTFLGIAEKQGQAMAGATIEVRRLDNRALLATTTTFDDGSFAVPFGAEFSPTLPIQILAKRSGESLGAVVAGGPLAIVAGGAGNVVAGGAGNVVAGGAGNVVAGGAGNVVAGGAGNVVAGGAGNIVAGGAGNIVAGGAGNIVAGGAGNIVAGGAGNIVAGGAGNIVAGGAGNIVAGGAGNIVAGGAGNIVAGGAGNLSTLPAAALSNLLKAGNIVAGGAGNIVAGGAGNIVAGGAGNIVAGGAGNIVAGGAGNIVAGGAGNIVAGGAGNLVPGQVLSGGLGRVIVPASASLKAAVANGIVAGGAGNIVAGGAGNIVAGGAGNIVAGGAGNLVAGGAGNRRLLQAQQDLPLRAVRLSIESTVAASLLVQRMQAFSQASDNHFVPLAAAIADAVNEGLTAFLANNPKTQGDTALQGLFARALEEGQPPPETAVRSMLSEAPSLVATIRDAAERLGLVVLGTATGTNQAPDPNLLGAQSLGQTQVPAVELPANLGSGQGNGAPNAGSTSTSSSSSGGGGSSSSTNASPTPTPSTASGPFSFPGIGGPSGGLGALGNPTLNGPGPTATTVPGALAGFQSTALSSTAQFGHLWLSNSTHLTTFSSDSSNYSYTSFGLNAAGNARSSTSSQVSGGGPGGRMGPGLVTSGVHALLFGGKGTGVLNSIMKLSTDTTTNAVTTAFQSPTLPVAVERPVAYLTSSNRVLVLGGFLADGSATNAIQVVNLNANFDVTSVTLSGQKLAAAVGGAAIYKQNNLLRILGGRANTSGNPQGLLNSVSIDASTGLPNALPTQATMDLQIADHGIAVHSDGQSAWILGGERLDASTATYVTNDRIHTINLQTTAFEEPTEAAGASLFGRKQVSTFVSGQRLYVGFGINPNVSAGQSLFFELGFFTNP